MATAARRRPFVQSSTRQTLSLMREALEPLDPGEVARTLEQLCGMGLLEKFVDEYRITRYRPTGGRIA